MTLDGLPDRVFRGRIEWIAPEVDPHTRTATARVPLENPTGRLRARMYGSARVTVVAAAERVFVPRDAVQKAKSATLVFVPEGDRTFVGHRVTPGAADGDRVEIVRGLTPGVSVVTAGSFFLKTETLKESIGAGCCEGD